MVPTERNRQFPQDKSGLQDQVKYTMQDLSDMRGRYTRNVVLSELVLPLGLLLGTAVGLVTHDVNSGLAAGLGSSFISEVFLGLSPSRQRTKLDAVEDELVRRLSGEELPARKNFLFKGKIRRAAIKAALG